MMKWGTPPISGNLHIDGGISSAMFDYQRVLFMKNQLDSVYHEIEMGSSPKQKSDNI